MSRAEALERARQLAAAGAIVILRNPQRDLENLGYDIDDVCDCIQELVVEDIDKTVEDQYRDDCCVLEFKPVSYGEDELYLKLSVPEDMNQMLIVLSFRLWGSPR